VWSNGIPLNRREYLTFNKKYAGSRKIATEPTTLADMFAAAGYDTASFGKLHLTCNLSPTELGHPENWQFWQEGAFDDWHGPYYGFRHVEITCSHGEEPCKMGHYANWLKAEHPDVWKQTKIAGAKRPMAVDALNDVYPSAIPHELHHSAWLADKFCDYLDSGRDGDKPFFAFLGFPDPHSPVSPCEDLLEQFLGCEVQQAADPSGEGIPRWLNEMIKDKSIAHVPPEQREQILRYTYAMVYSIDLAVGRVLDKLEQAGLAEDTIVVFTSDHGDYLCDHAMFRKSMIAWDCLVHVPFVLRAPGAGLPARVDTPMSNVDVMPTLAALAGVEAPEGLHGVDITQEIRDGREHVDLVHAAAGSPESVNWTLYDQTHRMTYFPATGQTVLYDHAADPGECRDLSQDASHAERIEAMKRELNDRTARCTNPIVGCVSPW